MRVGRLLLLLAVPAAVGFAPPPDPAERPPDAAARAGERVGAADPPARPTIDAVIKGKAFVDGMGRPLRLRGPNVVVKGPPWLPSTNGSTRCVDTPRETCTTFNEHDARHLVSRGWNLIRLGVTWAGAQPRSEAALDPAWLARLHAILDLCHAYSIHVILDIHQDAVGTAVCGEGVPMWFSQASPVADMIGAPLVPLSGGDSSCNASMWRLHAGEPDYNLRNPCCLMYSSSSPSWHQLGFTLQAQLTLHHLFAGAGRAAYARYVGLLAAAVVDRPAAIGIELFNEPMTIEREAMFATWRACYDAAREVHGSIGVGVVDAGQAALRLFDFGLSTATRNWLREASGLFYAFHFYTLPRRAEDAVRNAVEIGALWGMPVVLTEFMACDAYRHAEAANVSWTYWHYSQYCNTAPSPQCDAARAAGRPCNFGACICGWGMGRSNWSCDASGGPGATRLVGDAAARRHQ